jgi:hypothetical protein
MPDITQLLDAAAAGDRRAAADLLPLGKHRERSAKPEAHCNSMEGIGTGVRIFLAPFRGVSNWYQAQYAAVFEWLYNTKRITGESVRALLGLRVVTNPRT